MQEISNHSTVRKMMLIAQIEVGKRTPSLEIVEKLAYALGVEYKTLFETNLLGEEKVADEFAKHILEAKLIESITKTIHNEFSNASQNN